MKKETSKVFVSNIQDYGLEKIKSEIVNFLDREYKDFLSFNDKVLIKPNFLSPVKSTYAVTTHPKIVEAVLSILKDAGVSKIIVGDSPAVSNALKVARESGVGEVCEKFGVNIVNFNTPVKISGKFGRTFEIARDILEVDKIINLAKFKTHTHMIMTLSVKNMFGSIVGLRKSAWHAKTGTNKVNFADMLVELYETVKPALNIVDGIMGMEGNGPRNGKPRRLKTLLIGKNGHAVDFVACKMVRLEKAVPTIWQAEKRELLDPKNIEIIGDGFRIIDDFVPPDVSVRGITGIINPFGRFFAKFPKVIHDKCIGCEICKERCPAGAITMNECNKANIDINKCIRCYVCQEVCPQDAIELVRRTRGDRTASL